MTVKINLPLIAAVLTALAGAAGTALIPLCGQNLASGVQTVLQAVAGLLVLIPTYHVSNVAASTAKAKTQARLAADALSA